MPHTYQQSKELYYLLLRVPKDEAYFVYFTFESNEGLCYYSTRDESLKGQYRDIEVRATIEMRPLLEQLVERLSSEIRLDIIESWVISDS